MRCDRLLDLLQQLALAVARAQLEGVLFLDGGAVGRVGHDHGVFAQVLGGLAGVFQDACLSCISFRRKNAICLSFMYSSSGMARTSASLSSSGVLVFQLLASFGSFLTARPWRRVSSR
jgi:hypothetical protein